MIISPLKVWVQNILPVVYDDSLSYLEIVAKINAKTNEIITQTNANTNAIETLASTIAELGDIEELRALLDEMQAIVEDLYTTDAPLMDGTASAGSADHAARSDHVHPSDTSRAPVDHASSETTYGIGTASNYGHLKITDDINNNDSGTASKPEMVKNTANKINSEIAIVITNKRPSMAVSVGQYVVAMNGNITGITDGLYVAKNALSAGTDVTASDLETVNGGGLNDMRKKWTAVPAGDIKHVVDDPENPDIVNGTLSAYVNRSLGLCLVQWQGDEFPLSAVNHNFEIPPDIASKYRLTMPLFTNDGAGFLYVNGNTVRVRVTTPTANSSGSILFALS